MDIELNGIIEMGFKKQIRDCGYLNYGKKSRR